MKSVIFGAGNIGRGFIGLLFRKSGYEVTFIDVSADVVERLNERRRYPVRILSDAGNSEVTVDSVSAVYGGSTEAVSRAIAEADIMATAVGVNALKHIVPGLTAGLSKRFESDGNPLNIIICENLLEADKYLAKMIKERLTEEEQALFDKRVGLVEASIGRMVPVQTDEMKDGEPLRVCVERYGFLPVDKDAFKGAIPEIDGMIPYSPFEFYIRRKLFVHNMGHSVCAYLGMFSGHKYIYQAIDEPEILIIVKNAMLESAAALAEEYGVSFLPLLSHIEDLLLRFTNKALGDTCERVGADTPRKLGRNDRLIGSARLCEKQGAALKYIPIGIAAAVCRYIDETGGVQTEQGALEVMRKICGVTDGEPLSARVMEFYNLLAGGASLGQLRAAVQNNGIADCGNVV